jgi:hypothetical protein
MQLRWLILLLVAIAAFGSAGCLSLPGRLESNVSKPVAEATAAPRPGDPIARGQLVLHADFRLPQEHRLIDELVAERDLIAERLSLPITSEPIHVHLFADEAAYQRHVAQQFPGFPERRAIFVETDVTLAVYAQWGDSVAEDLRHEVAHGYLHAAMRNLPLWLDEGLAEYFEVGRGRRGLHRPHIDYLVGQRAVGWQPDLPRLEALNSAGDMTQLDYAEAWLWVHFLLEGSGEKATLLTTYLNDLRTGQPAEPLSARLRQRLVRAEPALIEHLESLAP